MNVYIAICVAIAAVASCMKFALTDHKVWLRLLVTVAVVGLIGLAALWTLIDTGTGVHR